MRAMPRCMACQPGLWKRHGASGGRGLTQRILFGSRRCRSQAFRERWGGYDIEYRIVRSGGEVRWIESRSFISYATDGRPDRVVGVNIDITERKLAEDQQRMLVSELDHRVKNVLATVSAVAAHTLDASPSMEHFVAALDGRIRSMAATHELLSQRPGSGSALRRDSQLKPPPSSD